MAEQAACAACGREGTLGSEVRTLSDVGAGEGRLHLCQGCLMKRAAKVWHANGSEGQRLQEALETRSRDASERFSYLEEPGQRIHLTRLNPDWIQEHMEG